MHFHQVGYATRCCPRAENVARNNEGAEVRMSPRGCGFCVSSGDPKTLYVGQVP